MEFCPRCGEWREVLDDCTGWCDVCMPYAPIPTASKGFIPAPPIPTSYCFNCGGPIYARRADAVYCSKPACKYAKERNRVHRLKG